LSRQGTSSPVIRVGGIPFTKNGSVPGSRAAHLPFGEYRVEPEAGLSDHGFTGHRDLGGLGLVHMKARFYVPEILSSSAPHITGSAGCKDRSLCQPIPALDRDRLAWWVNESFYPPNPVLTRAIHDRASGRMQGSVVLSTNTTAWPRSPRMVIQRILISSKSCPDERPG
jgi:hypothetical protein